MDKQKKVDESENLIIDDSKIIVAENLVKIYKTKEIEVVALQGLDLTISKGEVTAIIGNSGSGKSTLLNMLGALDVPSAGKLFVDSKNLLKMSKKDIIKYKRETVGFVWQNNARNLIPYLTASENIELPSKISGISSFYSSAELLDMVGLSHRKNSRLYELSGGEQQRVAIAIAVANNPKILLADEPTGAVDTKTTRQILEVFNEINKTIGVTVVIVTHDRLVTKLVNRVVSIKDGKISSEMLKKSYLDELKTIDDLDLDMSTTHDEFAILDKNGRIQIPADFIKAIDADKTNKIQISLQDDHIVLSNPNSD